MRHTLRDVLLAVTATDTDAVDNVALLSLVSKTASLVRARGARCAVNDIQLTVLPAPMVAVLLVFRCLPKIRHQTHRTRRRKRRTSDCFFLYSSPIYLYAPILRATDSETKNESAIERSLHTKSRWSVVCCHPNPLSSIQPPQPFLRLPGPHKHIPTIPLSILA